jgi:hypothetical protein
MTTTATIATTAIRFPIPRDFCGTWGHGCPVHGGVGWPG